MKYRKIIKAVFLKRPNRFIAHCIVNGKEEICHVKNTGRCKELLKENAIVYLEESDNPNRKTKYDLISVMKENVMINMDSSAPNKAALEWIRQGGILDNPTVVRPETKFGNSRLDFYIENEKEKAFVEVKGVTLEIDGVAMFPDAPTQRGRKHVHELIKAVEQGYGAYILFVIQMDKVNCFTPNNVTDEAFSTALKEAREAGVKILAMTCEVSENSMSILNPVEIKL